MNTYTIIILCALAVEFLLSLITDILSLNNLRGDLPPEFSDVWDAERYSRSQSYIRTNTVFGIGSSAFMLAVTLIFWFAGGFNVLDLWVRGFGLHPIWNGLIFVSVLMTARGIISLPFDIYHTFVIEERFGFNKTTLKTFVLDMVKGLALGAAIGGPLFAGILAFFQYAGPLAWLWCWMAVTVFSLAVQFIAPIWIMPLFNKFTPLETGGLRDRILSFAEKVSFPVSNIFVMDGSRRSSKSNAFFTGFGRHRRIALFDTLIEKHTQDQLVAVLAHEIGHYKLKHVLTGTVISIAHNGLLFFLLSLFLNTRGLFDAFYMDHMSIYAGLLFFGLLYAPAEFILSIIMSWVSRKNEYAADRFAAVHTGRPLDLASALKQLSADNLSNLRPHPLQVMLHYSHPPVLQRINALKKQAQS